MSNFGATQAAAQQESPYLTGLGQDATKFLNQVQGVGGPKDYSKFSPSSFWSMESLGDRSKQRDQILGGGATGDAALAGGHQAFLDLDKQNRNDEFVNDYGREFQDRVQGATANAKNTQLQLGQMEQDRRTGVASNVGNLFGMESQAYNAKPAPLWQSLVLGGMQALPGIINALGDKEDGYNGGRPPGQTAGQGGFGTYTGYGGQTYGSAPPSQFSTINTLSNKPRFGAYR